MYQNAEPPPLCCQPHRLETANLELTRAFLRKQWALCGFVPMYSSLLAGQTCVVAGSQSPQRGHAAVPTKGTRAGCELLLCNLLAPKVLSRTQAKLYCPDIFYYDQLCHIDACHLFLPH